MVNNSMTKVRSLPLGSATLYQEINEKSSILLEREAEFLSSTKVGSFLRPILVMTLQKTDKHIRMCPVCGSRADLYVDDRSSYYFVWCSNKPCWARSNEHKSIDEAINFWNSGFGMTVPYENYIVLFGQFKRLTVIIEEIKGLSQNNQDFSEVSLHNRLHEIRKICEEVEMWKTYIRTS